MLDAGCGTGSYSLALSPHIQRIEGVDTNVAMFERARQRAAEHQISRDRFAVHESSHFPYSTPGGTPLGRRAGLI